MTMDFDSNWFDRKKIRNIMIDLATIAESYHPIHIITVCADGSTVFHESDFVRKERHYSKRLWLKQMWVLDQRIV